jgi:archaellum biogenesis ATPase FlaH
MLVGFGRSGALAFPYMHTANDGKEPFTRVKFDKPGEKGKRYAQAKRSGNRIYFPPPPILDPSVLQDPSVTLYLSEGEKKCLKANQEGLPCVSVSGVDSWKCRVSGKSEPIKDLDLIVWRGRQVYLVYDSDLVTNARVLWAEFKLAQELASRGARVEAIRLPPGPNGSKVGLDDYLLNHSVDSFCQLEPIPIVHPEVVPTTLRTKEPLDSFLAKEIKAAPSLVGDGLIVEKGLHTLVGPTKKGKTIFAVQFALTVAGGLEYWLISDLLVHRACSVLYLNLELPEDVFEARLQKHLNQMKIDGYNVNRAWDNFRCVTLRGKMRLDRKDGRELLIRLIRETKAKLVVVDNLGAAMAVDSNSDERMAPIFLALYEICETEDVAILLVLHTPKELGERDEVYWARGSSIQADRADTIITIKSYGSEEQGIQRRIGFTLRCGPELDPLIVSRQKGSLLWTAGKQKDVRVRWLRDYLKDAKEVAYATATEDFGAAGHGVERTFRRALKDLGLDAHCDKDGFGGAKVIRWVGT